MSWPEEIVAAVVGLARQDWVWLATSVVALALGLAAFGLLPRLVRKVLIGLAVGGATAVGLHQAWKVKWLADDAYISFTYVKRFVEGHGWVLNPGEFVEGYTNFLWVALLTVAAKLGAGIPEAALVGNLGAFVALVLVAWRLPAVFSLPDSKPVLPLAALAVALGRPFHIFATSGLETDVALALCAVGVFLWAKKQPLVGSVLLGLGAMARPDHLLLSVALGAAVLADALLARSSVRTALLAAIRVAAPAIGLFTVYWLWRWRYYGEFFPNTFHAKSGGGSYFSQGYVYLTHAFMVSGAVLPAFGLIWAFPWLLKDERRRPLVLLALAVVSTHGLYVIRVGGDFMEFRFLLPTLYFVLLAWQVVCQPKLDAGPRWAVAAWALPLALSWAPLAWNPTPVKSFEKKWHLAAEETYYQLKTGFPAEPLSDLATMGRQLEEQLVDKGLTPRFALGCIGMVGYYSHLPLMDTFGLANRRVAKHPIVGRGRPGHEKFATLQDMLDDGAVFSDGNPWGAVREAATKFYLAGRGLWLVRYDDGLAALAKKEGWAFPHIEQTLMQMLQGYSRPQLEADRAFLEKFLDHSEHRAAILARVDARLAGGDLNAIDPQSIAPHEVPAFVRRAEAFGNAQLASALASRVIARWSFETDELVAKAENNFWPPAEGALPQQTAVVGYAGRRLVNTYRNVDRSTGFIELELQAPDDAARLNFLVGGGNDCSRVGVRLLDGEHEVGRWCGQRDEVLRAVDLSLEGLQQPRLRLYDDSQEAWGHLLVDDVMVYDGRPSVTE